MSTRSATDGDVSIWYRLQSAGAPSGLTEWGAVPEGLPGFLRTPGQVLSIPGLAPGTHHSLQAVAMDAAGNVGPPVHHTWSAPACPPLAWRLGDVVAWSAGGSTAAVSLWLTPVGVGAAPAAVSMSVTVDGVARGNVAVPLPSGAVTADTLPVAWAGLVPGDVLAGAGHEVTLALNPVAGCPLAPGAVPVTAQWFQGVSPPGVPAVVSGPNPGTTAVYADFGACCVQLRMRASAVPHSTPSPYSPARLPPSVFPQFMCGSVCAVYKLCCQRVRVCPLLLPTFLQRSPVCKACITTVC